MNVKVLSIKPSQEPNSHKVLLLIGGDRRIFKFTTEVNQVGGRQLQTTHGEQGFSDLFRFNQRVAMNVSTLVVKFYNQEAVELPTDVGNFVTPEEAVSKLKPFEDNPTPKTYNGSRENLMDKQQREEISQDVRQKAIGLVEKLPESLLDEAVKVLESLHINANSLE
ncbi:MAG: hypothetical protein F6K21_07840 [Symploca sp. SIO2D2]|nr:hypothetical protein [Symploca sp. SIO2D2]